MIYLLVLHDQMINAKFLVSRLFDESPSVALWSFQFFNRDDVTPINYLEHDDSGCHWCVWFLSFPIINPTGWCSFLHCFSYWLAHVLFDGRLACSGIFDSTVSDDVIRMMSHVDGFSKRYGCSSNNHNWITQPVLITHMFRDCKCYVFEGQGGARRGGRGGGWGVFKK